MGFSVSDFIELFGGNDRLDKNRWEVVCLPNTPKKLVILTNLIDMTYNYLSGSKYHVNHFTDLNNIRANTSGFIATHMFAEYLSQKDENNKYRMTYNDALKAISSNDSSIKHEDWYIGTAFAHATWRQAAVYRDRCTEGAWLQSFNTLFDQKNRDGEPNGEDLKKDYVQLRMCAKLMLWDSPYLKELVQKRIPVDGTRELSLNDFPGELRSFVEELARVKQVGGSAKKTRKTPTKKSTKKVVS